MHDVRSVSRVALVFALSLAACGDDAASGGSGGSGGAGGSGGDPSTGASGGTGGGVGAGNGTGGDDATLAVNWGLSVQGEAADCFFMGASWVDLAIEDAGGEVDVRRLECDGGEGVVALAPGAYVVTPSLVAFDESVVLALEAESVDVEAPSTDLALLFTLPGGKLEGTWTITQDGAAATCEAAGADRVEILASNASGFAYANTFDCTEGSGVTEYFPLGEYEVTLSLMYQQDVVLVTSDVIAVTLEEAGATVAMEPVEFVIE